MIVKLIKNKTNTATGAVNYCLGMIDSERNRRTVEPKILRGDPFLTKSIDNTLCKNIQNKATSGVISFRDKEKITDEQKEKLLDDFEKTFLGNMRDRVNILFIEHQDKGNLEIHFIINKVDLKTGKAFNPFPPTKSYELKDLFVSIKNEEFGFEQVIHKDVLKNTLSSNEKNGYVNLIHLNSKVDLDKHFQDLVKDGKIKNRDELLKYIKKSGLEVSRLSQDTISIKNDDGLNFRLKDGIYSKNDGKDYTTKIIENQSKPVLSIEQKLTRLNELIADKNNYNSKPERFGAKGKSQLVAPVALDTPTPRVKPIANSATATKPSVMARMEALRTDFTGMQVHTQPQHTATGLGGSSGSGGGGDIEGQINSAMSDLSNAKTDSERASAKARLAQLLAQKEEQARSKFKTK